MTRECLLRVVRPAPRSGARGRGDGASSVSRLMCPCQYFSSAIRYFDTSSANTSSTTTPTVSIPNFGIPQRAEPRASAASPGQDRPTTPSRRLLLSRSFCRRTIGTVGRFRGIDQLAVETNSEVYVLRISQRESLSLQSSHPRIAGKLFEKLNGILEQRLVYLSEGMRPIRSEEERPWPRAAETATESSSRKWQ